MPRTRKKKFTSAEYLAMEEVAHSKSEYYRGEIFALSGGSVDHSLITLNLGSELRALLTERPCRVFSSDLRVHVETSDLYTYSDVMVICGKLRFYQRRTDTVTNPLLIIEVLSPSTRDYDRGAKFEMYKGIPTLDEYVLVDSEKEHIERFHRRDGEWTVTLLQRLTDVCYLESLDCEIPLSQIYRKVTWLD